MQAFCSVPVSLQAFGRIPVSLLLKRVPIGWVDVVRMTIMNTYGRSCDISLAVAVAAPVSTASVICDGREADGGR